MSSLDVLVVLVCMASLAGNGAALCVYVDNTTCECASDDCDVIRNNFPNFQAARKILQNCTSNVTDICEIQRDENGIYMLRKNPEGAISSKICPLKVYVICMNNTDNLKKTNCSVTSPETFSKGNGSGVGQEYAQCPPLRPELGTITSSTDTTSFPASSSPLPFLNSGMPQHLILTVISIALGSVCLLLLVALIVTCMKLKRQRKGPQRGEITQSDMEVFDNQALYSGVISADENDDKTYMTIE